MLHSKIKTYKYRVGKNHFLVLQIFQSAVAKAEVGNVLASNAVTVNVIKNRKRK